MIQIERQAWETMVAHARAAYPRECCGAMLGVEKDGTRRVSIARPMRNAFEGAQEDTYVLDPAEQLQVERKRGRGVSAFSASFTRILIATPTFRGATSRIPVPGIPSSSCP